MWTGHASNNRLDMFFNAFHEEQQLETTAKRVMN